MLNYSSRRPDPAPRFSALPALLTVLAVVLFMAVGISLIVDYSLPAMQDANKALSFAQHAQQRESGGLIEKLLAGIF